MSDRTNATVTGLYMSYWSLQDPLCQTQSLAYLRELTARGHRFALMTFEQQQYALTPSQSLAMKRKLASHGIYWYPLNYHKRFHLLSKAFDFVCGVGMGLWIVARHQPRIVHSRASNAAAIALLLSRLCRIKFLYDADSTLSEEYADTGHWSRGSWAFRITAWLERHARRNAHSIVVLSERMRRDLLDELGDGVSIQTIPCCVDTTAFRYDPLAREARRRELGIGDEKLLVYVGKTGPRYLIDEMFEFFKIARERIGAARLMILSGDLPEAFRSIADGVGLDHRDYFVRHATRVEVSEWLSASDAGLAFIRSGNCERGSSPVKIGEYLAVGLPVVVTDGIGDYSDLIERERIGVVVKELTSARYLESADRLTSLWAEGDRLRERCRAVAEANISLSLQGVPRYEAVYQELLGSASPLSETEAGLGVIR
jgi:glycosyltransferase involved in cell wall biosynthesis